MLPCSDRLLLDAHSHDSVIGINHALKSYSSLAILPPGSSSRHIGRCAAAHTPRVTLSATPPLVAPSAAGTRTPWNGVALHGTLQNWRVVGAHARAHCSSFKAKWVKIVISTSLVVDTPCDLGGARCLRTAALRSLHDDGSDSLLSIFASTTNGTYRVPGWNPGYRRVHNSILAHARRGSSWEECGRWWCCPRPACATRFGEGIPKRLALEVFDGMLLQVA